MYILAYKIKEAQVFVKDLKSYLNHVLTNALEKYECFHVTSVCIGCTGQLLRH